MSNPLSSIGKDSKRAPLPGSRGMPFRVPTESEADMFEQVTGARPADVVRGPRCVDCFRG